MIHIACNIDSNYVRHCAVTLVSLFENNKEERFTAHIIARDLSENDKKTLNQLAARYQNQICFYEPDMSSCRRHGLPRASTLRNFEIPHGRFLFQCRSLAD